MYDPQLKIYCTCGHLYDVSGDQSGLYVKCPACKTLNQATDIVTVTRDKPMKINYLIGALIVSVPLVCLVTMIGIYFSRASIKSVLAPRRIESIPTPMSTEEIVSRFSQSVALVRGRMKHGTGFIVRPGLIATNAHVVEGESSSDLEIRFPSADLVNQGPFSVKVVYRDGNRDIALLSVSSKLPPLELDNSKESKRGREVIVIGCPGMGSIAIENAVAKGVMGPRIGLGSLNFDQLSAAINPGNSGGPVIDNRGRVVGVATLSAIQQQAVALCIPASDVSEAVARHLAHPNMVVSDPPKPQDSFVDNRILPTLPSNPDPLLAVPADDPGLSPAIRLAACDFGRVLPEDHPRVKESAELIGSAKLLFRQNEKQIVDYVIDIIAKLRMTGMSCRASDALQAMVECVPASDSPESRRDAASYATLYFRCKTSSRVHAEAVICMRQSVEAMERRGDKQITSLPGAPGTRPGVFAGRNNLRPNIDPRGFDDPGQELNPVPKEPAFLNRPGSEAKIPIAYESTSIERLSRLSRMSGNGEADRLMKSNAFFFVDDWTKVEVIKRTAIAALIDVIDGAHKGQRGWVPIGFLRFKAEPKIEGRAGTLLQSAKSLEAAGQTKQATSYYEKIVKEYPESEESKEAQKMLDSRATKSTKTK